INQAMAAGLFGDANPIGHRLAAIGDNSLEWGEIVGVVSDIRSVQPHPDPVHYQLYQPLSQEPQPYHELVVRTAGIAPSALVDGIRDVVTALDPDLPVRNLYPADTVIARATRDLGTLGRLLGFLA